MKIEYSAIIDLAFSQINTTFVIAFCTVKNSESKKAYLLLIKIPGNELSLILSDAMEKTVRKSQRS